MKIYAFNGSPRKNCNTAQMLQAFVEGVKSAEPTAQVEYINLYDYNYYGCKSCFACQLTQNRDHLCCQIRDDIHDILDGAFHADGLVFGSPIYFFDITAQLRAFLERLLYPGDSDKTVPSAFIYTMNANAEQMEKMNFKGALSTSKRFVEWTFRQAPECVYAYDTFQYNDREALNEGFRSPAAREKARHDEQFPIDLQSAREAGKRLVERIRQANK